MADGMNKTILIGNLGQDPELHYGQGAQARLRLRVATTESYLNRDKERQERTEWHNVIVWGKRAEALNSILSKGHRIGVEGRLQTRSWEANDGSRRYTTEVVATNILLLNTARPSAHGADNRLVDSHLTEPSQTLDENDSPF